jgi:hypothetical protein
MGAPKLPNGVTVVDERDDRPAEGSGPVHRSKAPDLPCERCLHAPICGWCAAFPCQCPPAREEACVCGGPVLRARGDFEWGEVIREHQRSDAHVAWRARV